jgi:SAM-dependent methyltransferase
MSDTAVYIPGYADNAVQFMTRRTMETHAGFFTPLLRPGLDLLDCGCGPGGITCGLARRVAPGRVVGVDVAESQILAATERAAADHLTNVQFQRATANTLPFAHATFDAVFSHALLEHLPDPVSAAREFLRVLRPGGVVGIRSPDWGGFILSPSDPAADAALIAYRQIQEAAGGDTLVGRKLGTILADAGFTNVKMGAEYECYPDKKIIAEYLALRLESTNSAAAAALHEWSRKPDGLFAQAWVHAVGWKPESNQSNWAMT